MKHGGLTINETCMNLVSAEKTRREKRKRNLFSSKVNFAPVAPVESIQSNTVSYTLTGHLRNGKKKRRQNTKRKENNNLHVARFNNQHFIWNATAGPWMRDTFCIF